ncbi:MAG: DUF5693 family protein [Elusimicrobiota bacterium]|nr:DUF5693 family protein [Elusimicrobiota bacterium]
MKKFLIYVFFVPLTTFFMVVAVLNILSWHRWYDERPIYFVLDIDNFIPTLSEEKNYDEISKIGINSFAVDAYRLYYNINKLSELEKKFVVKIHDVKYDTKIFDQILAGNDKIFSLIYISDKLIKFFGEKSYECSTICNKMSRSDLYMTQTKNFDFRKVSEEEIYEMIKKFKFVKLNFESISNFGKYNGISALRTFVVDLNQIKNINDKKQILSTLIKVKKAIFERCCSVIYFLPSEYLSFRDNLSLINQIIEGIKIKRRKTDLQNFVSYGNSQIFNIFTIVIAIFVPILFYKVVMARLKIIGVLLSYTYTNLFNIFLGIVLWGVNQRYEYIALESVIRGIKLMFILPVLLMPLFIFKIDELIRILNTELKIKHILIILAMMCVLGYVVLRTENVDKKFLLPFELELRRFIETYVLFRPRFKEIFFAQPLLFLSLDILRKNYDNIYIKILFSLSIISAVSIINTFLHTHTPIWLCILRSVLGTIIGLVVGIFYKTLYSKFLQRLSY